MYLLQINNFDLDYNTRQLWRIRQWVWKSTLRHEMTQFPKMFKVDLLGHYPLEAHTEVGRSASQLGWIFSWLEMGLVLTSFRV